MRFVNYPERISIDEYMATLEKVASVLLDCPGVSSVYQMGSIKNPGISDIDLICVFDGVHPCDVSIRSMLSARDRLMLTHDVFGVEARDLGEAKKYNFLSNITHVGGTPLKELSLEVSHTESVSVQIALEYLVKIYVTLSAQISFGVVNLRSFMLLAKAVAFDLELLKIKSGKLYDSVNAVIDFRDHWFDSLISSSDIRLLVVGFYEALQSFLDSILQQYCFYLPDRQITLPGGFMLLNGRQLKVRRKGIRLPGLVPLFGRRAINLFYRLNSFEYQIPFSSPPPGSDIERRFKYIASATDKNRLLYPGFIPLTSSLSIF